MIDVHTHIGLDIYNIIKDEKDEPSEKSDIFKAEELFKLTDEYGFDNVVTFPMPYPISPYLDSPKKAEDKVPYLIENRYVLKASKINSKIIPFIAIDSGSDKSIKYAGKMADSKRAKGIKFHGNGINMPISSLDRADIMDVIIRNDLPVIVHTDFIQGKRHPGDYCSYFADPMELLELAKKYPKVRFSAAHVGFFSSEFINSMKNVDNVWTDCSLITKLCKKDDLKALDKIDADYGSPSSVIKRLYEIIPEKLMWGSDVPYSTYEEEMPILKSLDEKIVDSITERNTRKFLKI
jgi:predicted TIM-barrel fold metal-dependent hydrolase